MRGRKWFWINWISCEFRFYLIDEMKDGDDDDDYDNDDDDDNDNDDDDDDDEN